MGGVGGVGGLTHGGRKEREWQVDEVVCGSLCVQKAHALVLALALRMLRVTVVCKLHRLPVLPPPSAVCKHSGPNTNGLKACTKRRKA